MAKMQWNRFQTAHPSKPVFVAVVSTKLSGAKRFDRNGKILPTPYTLLRQWLAANITGDWATTTIALKRSVTNPKTRRTRKVSSGRSEILLALADHREARKLRAFGVGKSRRSQQFIAVADFGYADEHYGALARSLGYAL